MANVNKNNGKKGSGDARERLAAGWGQMAASMVSPNGNGSSSNGNGANGNGRASGGAAPLPISALPLPVDDTPAEPEPAPSLPTNSEGKLSPAQRARLGLDIYGDDAAPAQPAQQAAAPAPAEPAAPPAADEQAQAAPTEFDFNGIDPYAQAPAPSAEAAAPPPIAEPAAPAVTPEPIEQPVFKPISDEPKLAPVSSEPRLNPVSKPVRNTRVQTEEEAARDRARKRQMREKADSPEGFEAIERDRSVLSYGLAWTAFAIVVTAGIAFSSALGGDPAAATGPGPLIPGLLSIAIGWVVVLAARPMGRGWVALMIIPALVLFVGPYFYRAYWSTSVEDAARSYLSPAAAGAQIDVDATSVVSQTVNTDRGCFGITRTRSDNNTQVMVVTYLPTTARQQADFALAPRYAGRVPAGGERTTQRIFNFKGGRAPAVVEVPRDAPLDCANSVSAPGSGADPASAEAQDNG